MHNGCTRRVDVSTGSSSSTFLDTHRATLTILTGPASGTEFTLDHTPILIGRKPAADIKIDLPSISAEHATLEVDANGFGIRDLASTNGVVVNGAETLGTALKHGDRIKIGECELQFVVEERTNSPRSWSVDEDQ
jgi:pSer/pThr/pTyr-binding forkhead associated (FHA) protein